MQTISGTLSNMPLFIRVVCLYIVTATAIWATGQIINLMQPATATEAPVVSFVRPILPPTTVVIDGTPSRLIVERLGINLEIRDGIYNQSSGEWTLSDGAAYFAQMTRKPNDYRGNTFIYGHNTNAVLARMSGIKVGDIVTINTTNGHAFHYVYTNDEIVDPSVTKVLNSNPPTPKLTIMTCEGIWSNVRRLMYFDFKDVS